MALLCTLLIFGTKCKGKFVADNHIEIFDKGGIVEVFGILESKFERFDEGKEWHDLLT